MKRVRLSSAMRSMALLVVITLTAVSQRVDRPLLSDPKKYSMDQCVRSFSVAEIETTRAGYQFWFADKKFLNGRTIKLSVVAPGKSTHEPHSHAEDEFFFVLEGAAEFLLNGARRTVGPMTSLYCPSMSEHGIRNAGIVELKYLVIKKYDIP